MFIKRIFGNEKKYSLKILQKKSNNKIKYNIKKKEKNRIHIFD